MAVATSRPSWFQDILNDYSAAVTNAFLIHGVVFDYIEHPTQKLTPTQYLSKVLGPRFTVVSFSPDQGIQFPGYGPEPEKIAEKSEARFRRVTGLTASTQTDAQAYYGGGEGEPPLPTVAEEALPLLVQFLERANSAEANGQRAVVIVERMDLIAPPGDKGTMPSPRLALLSLLHRAGTDTQIAERGNLMLMLSSLLEEVHPDLRMASSGIRAIEIAAPDFTQRLRFCELVIEEKDLNLTDITVTELAAQTAGLQRRHIEDIALRAARDGGLVTRELVKARKGEAITAEYAGLIEIVDPEYGFEAVGGHELAIEYLKKRVVATMTDPDKADLVPMGVALLGPSGTGKTFLADALAKEIGFNSVRGNIGSLRGGIVGETDRKTARFFAGLRALAPCVVFLDEVDQAFRRGQGGPDSGGGGAAENSLFASMLTFFGSPENRGQILSIAATNRPDVVDPAVFRPGRWDTKIPILAPDTAEDRAQVLVKVCRRLGYGEISADQFLAIGRTTDGWTQAELEMLAREANALVRLDGMPLDEALVEARASLRAATADVKWWTELAIKACNNSKLVPERYRGQLGGGVAELGAREIEVERAKSLSSPSRRVERTIELDDDL